MMKYYSLLIFLSAIFSVSFAQSTNDSAALAKRDSLRLAKMLESAIYPMIKGAKMGGAIPISNPEELPDAKMQYKLLMNFTEGATKPDKAKEINGALGEVARILNLHVAAGVPKEHLTVVVIAHGPALFSLLDDEHYRKKFKLDNPNSKIVKELQDAGVTFTACGQAMKFLEIDKENLLPGIKLAYSAKTVISTYSLKGFILTDVND
jgi:intracellular sulfur oxidation DsrE/DsrF family protein